MRATFLSAEGKNTLFNGFDVFSTMLQIILKRGTILLLLYILCCIQCRDKPMPFAFVLHLDVKLSALFSLSLTFSQHRSRLFLTCKTM